MFEATEDKANNAKYGMRAPPRRRIKTEESDDQPVFLRKAFVMMSNCPEEIGGWSSKGDTVIIKDVKLFSEKIIPTAYKHNNFSSFVRQLNFYGFRKVKSELLEQSTWWEFRHPQFLRDQPQLLSEIKRSIHYAPDPSGNQEVSDLKSQVGSLTDKIESLHDQIEFLSNAVQQLQMNSEPMSNPQLGKKRKIVANKPGVPQSVSFSRMCSIDEGRNIAAEHQQHPLSLVVPNGPDLQQMDIFRQNSLSGVSCASFTEMGCDTENNANDDWTDDLEALLGLDEFLDTPVAHSPVKARFAATTSSSSSAYNQETIPHASVVSAAPATGVHDLFSVLETLSPELKIRFVDKLAEVMGKQLTATIANPATEASPVDPATNKMNKDKHYNSKLPASSDSGNSSPSSSFAQLTTGSDAPYHLPSGARAPEIALPLASAALGAFVMSSLNSLVQNQHMDRSAPPQIKSEVV